MSRIVLKHRSNSKELDAIQAKVNSEKYIDASHLLKLLSYVIHTGKYGYSTLQELLETTSGKQKSHGFWLLRATETYNEDEHGWCCIHWPTLLLHMAWNEKTSLYLKANCVSPRRLQTTPLRELEGAYNQIDAFKARLRAALPPGSLLEADNSFYRQLIERYLPVEQHALFDNSPIDAFLRPWSVFRVGMLARTAENTFEDVCAKFSAIHPLSISKIDPMLLDSCPDVIKTLLTVFRLARDSDGKGWQRWGLAWVKAGLVFNYQLALTSLSDEPEIYSALFPGERGGPATQAGRWCNPAYLMGKPNLRGIPELGLIARNDVSTQSYIRTVTAPYKALFQDTDQAIVANAAYHGSDMKLLFKLDWHNKNHLLNYIKQLTVLSENKVNGEDIYEIKTIDLKAPEPTTNKDKKLNYKVYPVRFNAYNLGSTQEAPNEYTTVIPYTMTVCPYRGVNYISLPDSLVELFPVLTNTDFYVPGTNKHELQWFLTDDEKYSVRMVTKKDKAVKVKRDGAFALDLTFEAQKSPLVHKLQGNVYLHPILFAQHSQLYDLVDILFKTQPEQHPLSANEVEVFKNFWNWVYNPVPSMKQGKYSEEFAYPLGVDTKFCPASHRLDNSIKRMNFIVDKAMHSLDEEVAFIIPKGDRSAPRSKKPNSYDYFLSWYVAFHEIAQLPWVLDDKEQAIYLTKRWMWWRRPLSAVKLLTYPYPSKNKAYDRPDMETVFAYAKEHFGTPFTQY